MGRAAVYFALSAAALLLTLSHAADVTLPNGVEAVQLDQPTQSDSTLGDKPSVSRPDETFTGSLNPGSGDDTYLGTLTAGSQSGNPGATIDSPQKSSGRKMRKMLESDLHLSGDGVSAGDQNAGVAANAYGQGQLNQLDDSHIEPHGVQASVSQGGQQTTTGAAVNPDAVAGEGPLVEAGKK